MAQPTPPDSPKVSITIVVVTKPFSDSYPPKQKLKVAAEEAIRETGQSGDLSTWVLTFDSRKLDFEKTFEEEKIPDGATLHLNPKKGTGGV